MPDSQKRIHPGKLHPLLHVAIEATLYFINAEAVRATIADNGAIIKPCLEAPKTATIERIENGSQIQVDGSLPLVQRRLEQVSQQLFFVRIAFWQSLNVAHQG